MAEQEFPNNPLLTALEQLMQEKAPEWKLVHSGYSNSTSVSSEWSHGKDKAEIQIARMASAEEASSLLQLFAWHIPLTPTDIADMARDPKHFQLPQPVLPDARLPDLGDENHVWTTYDETTSCLIKLRSGNLLVHVDGSSFGVAEMLARLVVEHLNIVRAETAEDYAAVHQVNELAFGSPAEAILVDKLRAVADPQISLVAVKAGQVVGHIFFSPVSIEINDSAALVLGLGPLAILPEYQKQGLGSQLVREGLKECQRIGCNVVVLVGHPEYYPRFGFVPAKQKELSCEYPVPDDVFMVAELKPEALDGLRGLVKYRPEFNDV